MKLHGAGQWTRARRSQIAAHLAGMIVTEQSLPRIRLLATLIRRVLCESGELLDRMTATYPVLDINAHATVAPKKHVVRGK